MLIGGHTVAKPSPGRGDATRVGPLGQHQTCPLCLVDAKLLPLAAPPGLDRRRLDRGDRADHTLCRSHGRLSRLGILGEQLEVAQTQQGRGQVGDIGRPNLIQRHPQHAL